MNGAVITFEQYHGRENVGSSRIRAHWVINHWDDLELYQIGKKYDFIIYQKAYMIEHAKLFKGVKIFDICDPDYLNWQFRMLEMIEACDVVTTSTEGLAEQLRKYTNKECICVPDRLDFNEIDVQKVHEGEAKSVVWYGYSTNFRVLQPVLNSLNQMGLELIVISDKDFIKPSILKNLKVTNIRYNYENSTRDIIKGDIVLNPHLDEGRFKFKSNNKTINAWAINMPVATNLTELKSFISEENRVNECNKRMKEVKEKYDVKLSVEELKHLVKKYESK